MSNNRFQGKKHRFSPYGRPNKKPEHLKEELLSLGPSEGTAPILAQAEDANSPSKTVFWDFHHLGQWMLKDDHNERGVAIQSIDKIVEPLITPPGSKSSDQQTRPSIDHIELGTEVKRRFINTNIKYTVRRIARNLAKWKGELGEKPIREKQMALINAYRLNKAETGDRWKTTTNAMDWISGSQYPKSLGSFLHTATDEDIDKLKIELNHQFVQGCTSNDQLLQKLFIYIDELLEASEKDKTDKDAQLAAKVQSAMVEPISREIDKDLLKRVIAAYKKKQLEEKQSTSGAPPAAQASKSPGVEIEPTLQIVESAANSNREEDQLLGVNGNNENTDPGQSNFLSNIRVTYEILQNHKIQNQNRTYIESLLTLLRYPNNSWALENAHKRNSNAPVITHNGNSRKYHCSGCNARITQSSIISHFAEHHTIHLWEIEFSITNPWSALWSNETFPDSFSPRNETTLINTSISENAKRTFHETGCLDLTGKGSKELLELLGKGTNFVPELNEERSKSYEEALEFCRRKQITVDRKTKREVWRNQILARKRQMTEWPKLPPNTTVTKSDKSNFLILEEAKNYNIIGSEFLNNTTMWKKVNNDGKATYFEKFRKIDEFLSKNNSWYNKRKLIFQINENTTFRPKYIYFQYKTHKALDPQGRYKPRPIADQKGSYTEHHDELATSQVDSGKEMAAKIPTILFDSLQLCEKARNVKFNSVDEIIHMLVGDVEKMYDMIIIRKGIEAVELYTQEYQKVSKEKTQAVCMILYLVLSNNIVEFNGQHYLQLMGIAMGSHASPVVANCWLYYIERSAYMITKPILNGRLLDDIIIITNCQKKLDYIIAEYESDPQIKLTTERSERAVNMLDLTISRKGDHLETELYVKPTDGIAVLHRNSNHPNHTFSGMCYSQGLRLCRLSTNHKSFTQACLNYGISIMRRNYSWITFAANLHKVANHCQNKPWPYKTERENQTHETTNKLVYDKSLQPLYRLIKRHVPLALTLNKTVAKKYKRSKFVFNNEMNL